MPLNYNPDRDIPDLSGKVFFIIGGTGGLGASTAIHLAKHNASRIYISGRNAQNAEAVIKQIDALPTAPTTTTTTTKTTVTFIKCDLASLASVKAAATDFLTKESRLDTLICNAGIMATPPGLTEDGYEIQFGTNHLGHAMLVRHLLPLLQKPDTSTSSSPSPEGQEGEGEEEGKGEKDPRIIFLTSQGYFLHPRGGIIFKDLNSAQENGFMWSWIRYGQSKLANLLYARELAHRYPGITSVAIHPGIVGTGLVDGLSLSKRLFVYVTTIGRMVKAEEGAYNQLWAATVERVRLGNGGYYVPVGREGRLDEAARDGELARELWEWTEGVLDQF